jgi:hypothetical protein
VIIISGWWYPYPSEKYESQWEGLSHIMTIDFFVLFPESYNLISSAPPCPRPQVIYVSDRLLIGAALDGGGDCTIIQTRLHDPS